METKATGECPTGRAWIELDRAALRHNVMALRALLPSQCKLMPAVKANAYGHGAGLIARELNVLGVDSFCVACAAEGVELRRQNVKGEILVLGYTHPEQLTLLKEYGLSQTVVDYEYALQLEQSGLPLHVHVGVDTGMHRLGERSENIDRLCAIFRIKNLRIDGLFTHLCASDDPDPAAREYTLGQAERFYRVAAALEQRGIPRPKLHLLASYGVLNYPQFAEDYARVGIALYGVLSDDQDPRGGQLLRPVLSLKTRVASVRTLHAGESAGYGLDYTAEKECRIAALSIGYADGLHRALSNGKGAVLINGCRAPIAGRICMDQTLVDVSGVPDAAAGDTAVLIGCSGRQTLSACEMARQAGTITNEIFSQLGPRLERVWV